MKKQVREGRSLGIKEGVNGRSYERDEAETEDAKGSRGEGAARLTQEIVRQREKQVDGERGATTEMSLAGGTNLKLKPFCPHV